jgi:carboxyl-terminal processing protease
MVDGGSASASEILAGALQDNSAATIVGMQTFGKGSVQTLIPIDDASLKVTVARWITPAGHWIMGNGVTPDIRIGIATSTPKFTPDAKGDPQYDRAVQFLTAGTR